MKPNVGNSKILFQKMMSRRIKRVANEMFLLGTIMDYYGGFGEMGEHGREMLGASKIAKGWAKAIDKKVKKP